MVGRLWVPVYWWPFMGGSLCPGHNATSFTHKRQWQLTFTRKRYRTKNEQKQKRGKVQYHLRA